MKFQYIGDGNDSPEEIVFMGQVPFKLKGRFVDVVDPFICERLENHPCFRAKEGEIIEEAEIIEDGEDSDSDS